MFETSVVRAQVAVAKGRFSLLTISIIAHSAVVIGAIAVSIASVDFPTNAPDEYALAPTFMPVRIPPPLGNPNGGAPKPQPPAAQPAVTPPPQQPNEQTAPSIVPDVIPAPNAASSNSTATTFEGDPNATVPGPIGEEWGTEGSTGKLGGPPGPATNQPQVEEKIYEVHEVKAPVLLHRVAPPYPQKLVSTRKKAIVVVRCVIDKNGYVRDPQILRPDLPPFNAAVLEAVQQWRYTPGSRNGIAVETYLSVTVHFSVN